MGFDEYPREIQNRAEFIVDERFRLNDRSLPVVEVLYQNALCRTAELLIDHSDYWDRYVHRRELARNFEYKGQTIRLSLQNIRLPVFPQVGIELQQVLNDPNFSAQDLVKVVSKDPKLTASLLRMVNSALYSLRQPIETVSRAVALLGSRQISNLALGTLMLNLFKKPGNMRFDIQGYWRHCVACGIVARALAARGGLSDPERFFVAGMLHDIGQLAILGASPEIMEFIQAVLFNGSKTMPMVETEVLSFNHTQLGAKMLRMWSLPESLVEAVSKHHRPEDAPEGSEARIVHLAETMAKALTHGTGEGFVLDPLHEPSWSSLGIGIMELDELLDACNEKISAMTGLLSSMT
jgi:putative nucleotidyltransferase with HDIG domain